MYKIKTFKGKKDEVLEQNEKDAVGET